MVAILFVLLLAVPIAELYVIVQVAQGIGVLETIVLLFLVSIAGSYLLRYQGMATWRRLQATLNRGEIPTQEVTDGFCILLGGALLVTPGFLSDVVGLLLLFPPSRAVIKNMFRKVVFVRMARRHPGGAATVYTGRVVRERRRSDPQEGRGAGPQSNGEARSRSTRPLPPEAAWEDEDGSRGTA